MSGAPESASTTAFHTDSAFYLTFQSYLQNGIHLSLDKVLQITLFIHLFNKCFLKGVFLDTVMDGRPAVIKLEALKAQRKHNK